MAEYRVDELAHAAGTTVRNVRVYQDRGLLPPPRRQGRIGLYSEAHLTQLRLIGQLLDRGYTFATIGEIFDAWTRGHDLADTLGLREAITAAWRDETPERMSRQELRRRFGRTIDPELVERAVELGLIVRSGTGYVVPSPRLLEAGTELAAAGIPLATVLDLAEAVREDMARVAQHFFATAMTALRLPGDGDAAGGGGGAGCGGDAQSVIELVTRLRPHARRTVDALLAMAVQEEADRLLSELESRIDVGAPACSAHSCDSPTCDSPVHSTPHSTPA